jgi:PAS domain S-box-containing protein
MSEQCFGAIADYSYFWEIWINPAGRPVWTNPAVQRITGYSIQELMTMSDYPTPLIHEQDRQRMVEAFNSALEGNMGNEVQFHLIRKDGAVIWAEASWKPIYDKKNAFIGYRASIRDITARKRAEQQVMEVQERFSDFFKNAPIGFHIFGPDQIIADVNDAELEMIGYSRDEIVGEKTWAELIIPEERQQFKEHWHDIISKGQVRDLEYTLVHKDGHHINVILNASSRFDQNGNLINTRGSVLNITERKQAELALRVSEDNYRSIFNSVNDAIFVHNIETTKILQTNEKASEMFGYTTEQLLKLTVEDLSSGELPYTQEDAQRLVRKTVEEGPQLVEWIVKHKNGRLFWAEVSLRLAVIEGERRILAILRDISDRKEAELALRVSEDNYRSIFNSVNDAIFVNDIETAKILQINEKASEMFGYTKEELLKLTIRDISSGEHPYTQEEAQRLARKTAEEGPQLFEWIVKQKNGQLFWAEISLRVAVIEGENRVLAILRDISDRKEAEQALLAEKLLSEDYINSMPGLFYVFDEQRLVRWNKEWEKVTGYSAEELNMKYGFDFLDVGDRKHIEDKILQVFRDGTGDVEAKLVTKDGRRIPYYFSGLRREFNGKFLLIGLGIDITERKQAEEKLTNLAKFPSENPNPVLRISKNGEVLYSNEAGKPLLAKWKCGAGKTVPAKWRSIIAETFKSAKGETEEEVKDKIFSLTITPVKDAGYANLYAIDITDRKEAEQALRKSEELARASLNATSDMVYLVDTDGNALAVNEIAARRFGATPDELLGKNTLSYFPPDLAKSRKQYADKVALTGKPVNFQDEREGYFSDISIYPTFDSQGKVDRLAIFVTDITKRKRAEQASFKLNKELDAKNKELESILYAASHDLRSPLVNIQGFGYELSQSYDLIRSALMSKGKIGDMEKAVNIALNKDIPNALDFILASSIKMDSLLSGLLDYCRLGTAAMNVRPIDMNTMMADVSGNMEYQIKETKSEVDIEPLLPCLGDPSQINRVFTNLLTNALKFFDESRPGRIRIYSRSQDDQSIYCVEDNGIGIAPEHYEEIFEIFYQLEPEERKGDGLGLTIVRRIIERNNGRIWVESEKGKGSKFFVSLPSA